MKSLFYSLLLTPAFAIADEAADKTEQVKAIMNTEGFKLALQNHGSFGPEVIVPVAVFLFTFGVVFIKYYWQFRQNQELQQSIRLMVEKGVDIPMELLTPDRETPTAQKDFRRGLILTGMGLVIPAAILYEGDKGWVWGFIPLVLGISYLISARVQLKKVV